MEQKQCPRCNYLLAMGAKYCVNCGYSFVEPASFTPPPPAAGRSGLLTAGGVLLIVGSCWALIGGLIVVAILPQVFGYHVAGSSSYYSAIIGFTLAGAFGLLGFALGLASGIQSLRRKQFAFCVAGAVLLLVGGVLDFATITIRSMGIVFVLLFGIPVIVLAVLGLAFVAARKKAFSIQAR